MVPVTPLPNQPEFNSTVVMAKNSAWTTLDTLVDFIFSFICSVAVARILGPEKMGYYIYILWVARMMGLVGSFGIPGATRKYAAEFFGQGNIRAASMVISVCFRYQLVSSLVVVAAGLGIVFLKVSPVHHAFAVLGLVSVFPAMLGAVATMVHAAREDFSPNVRASLIGSALNLVGVLVSLLLGWDLVGLAATLLVSQSVDCFLRHYFLRQRLPVLANPLSLKAAVALPEDLRARLVRFCWQGTLLQIMEVVVWNRSEIFFLERFCDIRQVAFFSLGVGVVQQVLVLPRIIAWASGASLMVQHARDPQVAARMVATTVRFLALLAFPLTLGVAALSSPAIRILYGQNYLPAIPVLMVIALFSIPKAFLLPAQQVLMAAEHQGFLLKWGLLMVLLNVSLDLWWIPKGEAMGAALGNGVSQFVAIVGIWVFAVRRLAIPFPVQPVLKMLASAVIMALVVATMVYSLPPLVAMGAGVIGGAALFATLVRWTRAFDEVDRRRLLNVQGQLPSWLRRPYALGVQTIVA